MMSRVESDFLSAIASRVGSGQRFAGSGPRKITVDNSGLAREGCSQHRERERERDRQRERQRERW